MQRRNKLEQAIALFRSIKEHPNDSAYWIIMATRINYSRAYKMLHEFNDAGFLTFQPKEKREKRRVRLTKKGSEWLKVASKLLDDIAIVIGD